jgi:glycerol kinase
VERPAELETTTLGAAFLAGMATGVWRDLEAVGSIWQRAGAFEPRMDAARRQRLLSGWQQALRRTLGAGH